MREVTRYQTFDGKLFETPREAEEYEHLAAAIVDVMLLLGPDPRPGTHCQFENGNLGYIQHGAEAVTTVKTRLLAMARQFVDHPWVSEENRDKHPSWAQRIIGECCPAPLHKAWDRIVCIDKEFREWGQPFYAAPENATQRPNTNLYIRP